MTISEAIINERRNWKAQTFPYDYYITEDQGAECLYCLTEKQAEILRGIIEPLAWKTRWFSLMDTYVNQDDIQAFRDDIVRRLMMSCCDDSTPVRYRFTEDGTLQRSTDNGETWEDAPNEDPRNNSTYYPPIPDTVTDKRCAGAESGMLAIKQQVGEQLTDDMSTFTLGELIKTWVEVYIQTSNPFTALITVTVNQIFALVIATLRPSLTDPIYEALKCILFCNMSEDQSVNNEQWAQIRADITDQIGGIAGIFLEHLIYLLGAVGTTNIIRSGITDSGDCSECDCGECTIESWIHSTRYSGLGTVLSYGADYVEVQSSLSPDFGAQAVGLINTSGCCVWVSEEHVIAPSAGLNNFNWYCGSDPDGAPDEVSAFAPSNAHPYKQMIRYGGSTVFVIKIFFTAP